MGKQADNKAIVGRWFTEFWGKTCNLGVVDRKPQSVPRHRADGTHGG